jgi:hypothetical protein
MLFNIKTAARSPAAVAPIRLAPVDCAPFLRRAMLAIAGHSFKQSGSTALGRSSGARAFLLALPCAVACCFAAGSDESLGLGLPYSLAETHSPQLVAANLDFSEPSPDRSFGRLHSFDHILDHKQSFRHRPFCSAGYHGIGPQTHICSFQL